MELEYRPKKKSDVLFSMVPVFREPEIVGTKARRANEVYKMTVKVGDVAFDADESSMDRMARIISLANWKFNKATSSGMAATAAYQLVYMTMIPWKTADNLLVQITVETLCEAQDAAVNQMGEVWVRYA